MSRITAIVSILGLSLTIGAGIRKARAAEEHAPEGIKNPQAKQAIAAFERAASLAKLEYDNKVAAERRKLQQALETAQTAATKAGDLEDAVRIRDFRATVEENLTDSVAKAKLIETLNSKTWYWHWETPNRERPMKFNFDATGRGEVTKGKERETKWTLERRWTLTDGQNVLVPIDDHQLRGFFTKTGREIGAFAERDKDKK